LAVDLNDNATDCQFTSILNSIGLIEAITTKYSSRFGLEGTYQTGSVPIDRIYISSSVLVSMVGYYLIGQALLDYYAIWLKLSIS